MHIHIYYMWNNTNWKSVRDYTRISQPNIECPLICRNAQGSEKLSVFHKGPLKNSYCHNSVVNDNFKVSFFIAATIASNIGPSTRDTLRNHHGNPGIHLRDQQSTPVHNSQWQTNKNGTPGNRWVYNVGCCKLYSSRQNS